MYTRIKSIIHRIAFDYDFYRTDAQNYTDRYKELELCTFSWILEPVCRSLAATV